MRILWDERVPDVQERGLRKAVRGLCQKFFVKAGHERQHRDLQSIKALGNIRGPELKQIANLNLKRRSFEFVPCCFGSGRIGAEQLFPQITVLPGFRSYILEPFSRPTL